MGVGSGQSSFHQYDVFINDEEYLTPNTVDEMTLGQSDQVAL